MNIFWYKYLLKEISASFLCVVHVMMSYTFLCKYINYLNFMRSASALPLLVEMVPDTVYLTSMLNVSFNYHQLAPLDQEGV